MRDRIVTFLRERGVLGDADHLVPTKQIITLGGNPLPVRVALEALQPKQVAIIATETVWHTAGPALQKQYVGEREDRKLERVLIGEAWHTKEVRAACVEARGLLGGGDDFGLHYTAGTKVMSAETSVWFQEVAREEVWGRDVSHRRTYLDAERGLVFAGFDVAFDEVRDVRVSIKDMLALHGCEITKSEKPQGRTFVDRLAAAWLFDKGPNHMNGGAREALERALPPFYEIKNTKVPAELVREGMPVEGTVRLDGARADNPWNFRGGAYKGWPLEPLHAVLGDVIPREGTLRDLCSGSQPGDCVRYVYSGWFEDWLAYQLADYELFDEQPSASSLLNRRVLLNPLVRLPGVQSPVSDPSQVDAEIDTVCLHGHTAVLVSATVADVNWLINHKAMEAVLRSRQLGGDHARFVLASFAGDDLKLQTIWMRLASHWGDGARFRVLGLPHYQGEAAVTWVRDEGRMPVRETMTDMFKNWLS